jgi:ribosomal protein S18 acetylase RimI-like enzyme
MSDPFVIESALPTQRADAFRLIFQHLPHDEREARVTNAEQLIQRGELDGGGLFVARGAEGLLGALVCTPAPGAGALIWPPQIGGRRAVPELEDALVRRACAWLRSRGVKLAQALLPPPEASLAGGLLRNGFARVTTLWYFRHSLEMAGMLLASGPRLSYRTYPRDPDLFHETLLRTYEGTADCPEVSGIRTIKEVIEGHRAQGEFDPERWWLALRDGRAVGVLLLTRMPEWDGYEVSYVGVVPEARRQGCGGEMMRKALLEARAAGGRQLTLSVDVRNRGAWEMYRHLGFEPLEQRAVFLAVWKEPG